MTLPQVTLPCTQENNHLRRRTVLRSFRSASSSLRSMTRSAELTHASSKPARASTSFTRLVGSDAPGGTSRMMRVSARLIFSCICPASTSPPDETKEMIDTDLMKTMAPFEVRTVLEDGNFGGRSQRPDAEMQAIWDIAVAETRALLETW